MKRIKKFNSSMKIAFPALLLSGAAHAFSVNVSGTGAMTIDGTGGPDDARVIGQGTEGAVVVKDGDGNIVWNEETVVTSILFIGKGGENKFRVKNVSVAGKIEARGGSGDDIFNVVGTLDASRLVIDHAGGNNRLFAGNEEALDTLSLDNGLTYDSGNGKDKIIINELKVADGNPADTMISTGGGNDTVEITGGGADFDAESRRLVVETGAGNDYVSIYDLDFTQGLQVFTGPGKDEIYIDFNYALPSDTGVIGSVPYIDAIAGPGKDVVYVVDNQVPDINVNCGSEKDKFAVYGNVAEMETVDMCEVDLSSGS